MVVRVVVPEKLNDKQRKLLKELGESLGLESLGKDNRSLFEKLIDAVGMRLGSSLLFTHYSLLVYVMSNE